MSGLVMLLTPSPFQAATTEAKRAHAALRLGVEGSRQAATQEASFDGCSARKAAGNTRRVPHRLCGLPGRARGARRPADAIEFSAVGTKY